MASYRDSSYWPSRHLYILEYPDQCRVRVKAQERIYNLSRGVESLSKEEHGMFYDAMHRLGLPNEVKQAAVALYLDFKSRPIGEYNADRKNLDIFLIASVSLAAKVMGDLRTDQEFESKMFVSRDRLVDAEERILKSFRVETSPMPFPQFVVQLTKRQIRSMAEVFAERGLINGDEMEALVQRCYEDLDAAIKNGLGPKMGYRSRAAGVMSRAARDMGLAVPEADIARASGVDKRSMAINTNAISVLLKSPKRL